MIVLLRRKAVVGCVTCYEPMSMQREVFPGMQTAQKSAKGSGTFVLDSAGNKLPALRIEPSRREPAGAEGSAEQGLQ